MMPSTLMANISVMCSRNTFRPNTCARMKANTQYTSSSTDTMPMTLVSLTSFLLSIPYSFFQTACKSRTVFEAV